MRPRSRAAALAAALLATAMAGGGAAGKVDGSLFDVVRLMDYGYTDQRRASLPLLVERADKGTRTTVPGGRRTRAFSKEVGIDALVVEKKNARTLWKSLAKGGGKLGSGVKRVWLERKLRPVLDESVVQVGAPPVNDSYTRLNGTSMATPHVAGAAALLAGKNPAWQPKMIGRALTSAAKPLPGLGAYAQGTGRLDVTRAIGQDVILTPGKSIKLPWPHPAGLTPQRKRPVPSPHLTSPGNGPLRC